MSDVFELYKQLVENAYAEKKLSRSYYESLINRKQDDYDELLTDTYELIHALTYAEYYITLDRIEKGEEMLAKESDDKKKSEYRKLLNDLTVKLEQLIPKGESA